MQKTCRLGEFGCARLWTCYPHTATLTYFPAARGSAGALRLAHVPPKRMISTAQVRDQANLCGAAEYTKLRSDIFRRGRGRLWRDRIKHGARTAFDLPHSSSSVVQRTSEEPDARAAAQTAQREPRRSLAVCVRGETGDSLAAPMSNLSANLAKSPPDLEYSPKQSWKNPFGSLAVSADANTCSSLCSHNVTVRQP